MKRTTLFLIVPTLFALGACSGGHSNIGEESQAVSQAIGDRGGIKGIFSSSIVPGQFSFLSANGNTFDASLVVNGNGDSIPVSGSVNVNPARHVKLTFGSVPPAVTPSCPPLQRLTEQPAGTPTPVHGSIAADGLSLTLADLCREGATYSMQSVPPM